MVNIAVSATSFCSSAELRALTAQRLAHHHVVYAEGALEGVALARFLANADGAIVGRERIDDALLAQLPRLKALAKYGVGIDNVDLAACARRGIHVYVEQGVNATSVAELTVGLMIAVLRNLATNARLLHEGLWHKDGGRQLSGKTVAIVGCGHVGSRVARILSAFGCPLLLCDIVDKAALAQATSARLVSFAEALAEADVVSLHVPLTAQTQGMMSTAAFNAMRPGSVLINTSRGEVVDQEALKVALKQGTLGGAGLDVFDKEPLTDSGLYSLPNVVATPHIAGNSKEAVYAMGSAALAGIAAHFS